MTPDLCDMLSGPADQVAPRLLGSYLVRQFDDQQVVVKIVETEAYDQYDAASHSFKGETPRTKIMFGRAGFLYVYFTYGMHYCCNVVTGPVGYGSAVLIRAVEPVEGESIMSLNRNGRSGQQLSNGPAKLCQSLDIDKRYNGHDLSLQPLRLIIKPKIPNRQITQTTRIGITKAKDVPWRFYIKDNPCVSKT